MHLEAGHRVSVFFNGDPKEYAEVMTIADLIMPQIYFKKKIIVCYIYLSALVG
jgi:hypothetical protein